MKELRHIRLGLKLLRQTRLNSDFLKFVSNFLKSQLSNKEKSTTVHYPTHISLELSGHCNLHCITCPREYAFGKAMEKGYMPLENAKKIIDEVYPYLISISLTGLGETFLYPHLTEVLKYIKSKKKSIITTMSTNALFDGFMERLEEAIPYIDNLQISVDGVGDGYQRIRPNTDFELLRENITKIMRLSSDTEVRMNMVITRKNYDQLPHIVRFAHEMGIKFVNANYLNVASVTELDSDYYNFFHSQEFKSTINNTNQILSEYPDVNITGLDFPGKPGIRKCPFVWTFFYITWNGFIAPCCAKPFPKEYNYGNVYESSVLAILNSDKARAFRHAWQINRPLPFCKHCQFIEL